MVSGREGCGRGGGELKRSAMIKSMVSEALRLEMGMIHGGCLKRTRSLGGAGVRRRTTGNVTFIRESYRRRSRPATAAGTWRGKERA